MSAEDLGRRLLAEVEEGSLSEVSMAIFYIGTHISSNEGNLIFRAGY